MSRVEATSMTRHEVPTHLNVEDKAFWGLSVRQALTLASGLSGGYSLWTQWPDLPELLRLALAVGCLMAAAILALVRPGGRALEEWAFVALHYAALPKASVWRHGESASRGRRPHDTTWAELAPRVVWRRPEEEQR